MVFSMFIISSRADLTMETKITQHQPLSFINLNRYFDVCRLNKLMTTSCFYLTRGTNTSLGLIITTFLIGSLKLYLSMHFPELSTCVSDVDWRGKEEGKFSYRQTWYHECIALELLSLSHLLTFVYIFRWWTIVKHKWR